MQLSDLNKDERLALVGFVKVIIQADKEFSEQEAEELKKVAGAIGIPEFKETVKQAKEQFKKVADLKEFARKIERQPARELIFSCIYDVALPGDIVPEEAKVLSWLSKLWKIGFSQTQDG